MRSLDLRNSICKHGCEATRLEATAIHIGARLIASYKENHLLSGIHPTKDERKYLIL